MTFGNACRTMCVTRRTVSMKDDKDNVIQVDFTNKNKKYTLNDLHPTEGTVTFKFDNGNEFITELPDLSKENWANFFEMQSDGMFDGTDFENTITITVDNIDQPVYTLVRPEDEDK